MVLLSETDGAVGKALKRGPRRSSQQVKSCTCELPYLTVQCTSHHQHTQLAAEVPTCTYSLRIKNERVLCCVCSSQTKEGDARSVILSDGVLHVCASH